MNYMYWGGISNLPKCEALWAAQLFRETVPPTFQNPIKHSLVQMLRKKVFTAWSGFFCVSIEWGGQQGAIIDNFLYDEQPAVATKKCYP